MSGKEISFCAIDDDSIVRDIFRTLIPMVEAGSQLAAEAASIQEAQRLIDQFPELAINAVILDGNLSRGQTSGDDGCVLAKRIRSVSPETVIIECSSGLYGYGDFYIAKPMSITETAQTLRQAIEEIKRRRLQE